MYKIILNILTISWLSSPQANADHQAFVEARQIAIDEKNAGHYMEAHLADLEAMKLADKDIEKSNIYIMEGQFYILEGNYSESRKSYLQVLSLNDITPSLKAVTRNAISTCYMAEGNFEGARHVLDDAILAIGVDDAIRFSLQLSIAQTYFHQKNLEQARQEYVKLSNYREVMETADVTKLLLMANSYVLEKNWTKSLSYFLEALTVSKVGDIAETTRPLTPKEILFLPNAQRARLGIALSYLLSGNKENAKTEYMNVLLMHNLDPSVRVEAEKQLKQMGRKLYSPSERDVVSKTPNVFLGQFASGQHITKTVIVESLSKSPFFVKSAVSIDPHVEIQGQSDTLAVAHAIQFDAVVMGKVGDVFKSTAKLVFSNGASLELPIVGMIVDTKQALVPEFALLQHWRISS